MNKEELEVINFTNITDKEWTGMWAQEAYVFKPGETRAFPRFLADHFCKHLGDRILIDRGQDMAMDSPFRKELTEKMLGKVAVPAHEEVAEEKQLYKYETKDEAEFVDVPKEEAEAPAEVEAQPKKRGRKVKIA